MKKLLSIVLFLLASIITINCFGAFQPIHLKFDLINSQQEINHPFFVSLIADEPDFDGVVYLNSTRGKVAPTYIKMHHGVWHGQVTVYEPGQRTQLLARWYNPNYGGSEVAFSNNFDVNNSLGQISPDATLTGVVSNGEGVLIAHAEVDLYNDLNINGNPSHTIISNAEGRYLFQNVAPGKYYIHVRRQGYYALTQPIQLAAARTITKNLLLAPVYSKIQDDDKIPLLLVPGFTGSTTGDYLFTIYPRLPKYPPQWDSGELSLADPFYQIGWHGVIISNTIIVNGLEAALIKQGYRLGNTLFEVPYDWSLPIPEISKDYLEPWIEYAKKISGAKQVDIIAHSMGGLVVRAYVQSPTYQHDVRRFAVVGTPNHGADLSYFGWEGGDPIAQDDAAGNQNSIPPGYFYSNTLNYLTETRISQNVCTFHWYSWKPESCDDTAVFNFLHNQVLSAGQLMPTYKRALLKKNKAHPIKIDENTFLKALNHTVCSNSIGCYNTQGNPYHFTAPNKVFSRNASKVQTALFSGIDNNTLQSILITRPSAKPFYQDGTPDGQVLINQGDGTVVSKSVRIPEVNLPQSTIESQHVFLIKNYIASLISFIEGKAYDGSTPVNQNNLQRVLLIETDGDVQPALTINTVDGKDAALETRIDNGFDRSTIAVINPPDGNYDLTIKSPFNQNYELTISYFNMANFKKTRVTGARFENYNADNANTLHFTLNTNDTNKTLVYGDFAKVPYALLRHENDHSPYLTWYAPIDMPSAQIAHYEIYAKRDDQPYFTLLGISQKNNFKLSAPFNIADQTSYTYAVDAILQNGTRTALSRLQ